MDKLAYQIPEAVVATGLSRSTLYEEIQAGRLRAFKVGGRRLILCAELQSFLMRCVNGESRPADLAYAPKK